ncbi:methyltransferase [Peptococcaceae bacterium 1198_IL3148]
MPNLTNPVVPQELLVVGAALQAGLFDAIREEPCTLDELATKLGFDLRALWTVNEALISQGYLNFNDNKYSLTVEAEEILFAEESDKYIGNALIHTFNVIKSWTQIPEVLKTGAPVPKERTQQDIKGFMAAMKRSAKQLADEITAVCLRDLPKGAKVLDLGGGPLNYARPFAAAGAEVTVQDLPGVCQIMEKNLSPDENIKFAPGDFTREVIAGQFDLAFLGSITHIYGKEENIALFKRIHNVLKPGGRIVISDFVRGVSARAELFAVNMLVNTKTGGTWTLKQYTDWLEQAGYRGIKMHQVKDRQLIIAQA